MRPPALAAVLAVLVCALPAGLRADADGEAEAVDEPPLAIALGPYFVAKPADVAAMALDPPKRLTDDITLTHAGFGSFERDADAGRAVFVPATTIVQEEGRRFGWVLRFDMSRDSVTLEETFTLPERNTVWTVDEAVTQISDDGKSATTTTTYDDVWDWVFNFWGFDPGDPVGTHRFVLKLAGKPVAEFACEIVEPEP